MTGFLPNGKIDKVVRWLARPSSARVITAIALVLVLPSLSQRFVLDDYLLGLFQRKQGVIDSLGTRSPVDFFTFTTGVASANHAMMDQGVLLPWWTDERHLNAFFRPLSSLTHFVDFSLWPQSPLLMHAHSIAWFAALLLVVAWLYRGLSSAPWLCGFAFLLFAFDDAHGATLSWLANRNSIIAATFAFLGLGFHHKYRSQGWRAGAYLGPFTVAVALLAGESALAAFAYLFAYALCIERGSYVARFRSLWGFALVAVAWLCVYRTGPFGSVGSGAYHDPVREPVAFIRALSYNLPVLLAAQFTAPIADAAFWAAPEARMAIFAFSLVAVGVIFQVAWPLLRRDRISRFWATSTLLAGVPIAASLPGERLLLLMGVGGSALMAQLIASLCEEHKSRFSPSALRKTVLFSLVLLHLVHAPLLLPTRSHSMNLLGASIDRANRTIPISQAIADKTVVIINAPFDAMVSYLQVMREYSHQPRPAHFYWLSTASSSLRVTRVADRTFRITPREGFIYSPPEQHYRSDLTNLSKGSRVRLTEMQVTIVETGSDGRPKTADFTFESPLESGRYLFLYWSTGAFAPFSIPAIGTTTLMPSEEFYRVVILGTWSSLLKNCENMRICRFFAERI
jgi:hypothetical protein